MPPLRTLLSIAAWLAAGLASTAWAEVAGIVVDETGGPVEGAVVAAAGGAPSATTGPDGRFRFAELEPPLTLEVRHPAFHPEKRDLAAPTTAELTIALTPKQAIYEAVVVSASRGGGDSPTSIAATLLEPAIASDPPATLAELVATSPGVAENGQGGLFQTYSVRGVARQRVLTLISGARIVGERRAGVSVSFLDPTLLGSVEVLRGPSSTYYGSGALGGVVQLFPRVFDGFEAEAGYRGQGDESHLALGWGGGGWSLGLARRAADGAETPAGEPLFSGFEQTSATVRRAWSASGRSFELLAIASAGRDIEKSSTDFPERVTIYPAEDHLLVRFAVERDGGWRFEAFVHPNELETRVTEESASSRLSNEAFDLGFNWQREAAPRGRLSARYGVDYFGRRGVSAIESGRVDGFDLAEERSLDGAQEDEAGVYAAVEWRLDGATLLGGSRLAWQRQANRGAGSTDDAAWTGFAGAVVPLGPRLELKANLGSGLRFPSLSERFFEGVTGRGQVVGGGPLEPERSLNADLGLRYAAGGLFVSAWLFRNEIDDYIERIEVEPGVLTFVNLTSGTIEGVELEGIRSFGERASLHFGGHAISGRDAGGAPLADVPADGLFVEPRWRGERWSASLRWERRLAKSDPGSGEKPIPEADLVAASVEWRWRPDLALRLAGRNLLDETYFNSADRKVSLAPGRSLGLTLRWSTS